MAKKKLDLTSVFFIIIIFLVGFFSLKNFIYYNRLSKNDFAKYNTINSEQFIGIKKSIFDNDGNLLKINESGGSRIKVFEDSFNSNILGYMNIFGLKNYFNYKILGFNYVDELYITDNLEVLNKRYIYNNEYLPYTVEQLAEIKKYIEMTNGNFYSYLNYEIPSSKVNFFSNNKKQLQDDFDRAKYMEKVLGTKRMSFEENYYYNYDQHLKFSGNKILYQEIAKDLKISQTGVFDEDSNKPVLKGVIYRKMLFPEKSLELDTVEYLDSNSMCIDKIQRINANRTGYEESYTRNVFNEKYLKMPFFALYGLVPALEFKGTVCSDVQRDPDRKILLFGNSHAEPLSAFFMKDGHNIVFYSTNNGKTLDEISDDIQKLIELNEITDVIYVTSGILFEK